MASLFPLALTLAQGHTRRTLTPHHASPPPQQSIGKTATTTLRRAATDGRGAACSASCLSHTPIATLFTPWEGRGGKTRRNALPNHNLPPRRTAPLACGLFNHSPEKKKRRHSTRHAAGLQQRHLRSKIQ